MASLIQRYAKKLGKDEKDVVKILRRDEWGVEGIYRFLIEEVTRIAKVAMSQDFVNVIPLLKGLIDDLKALKKALPDDHKAHEDIDNLIERIVDFIGVFESAGREGAFSNSREKLNQFVISMENAFKETILRDLKEVQIHLERALGALRNAA